MLYFLPEHGALTSGDALIGAGPGRVQVAPLWWVDETPAELARYREAFRPALRRLLAWPIELLLVSHGPPVLANGRDALAAAVDGPAWGE